MTKYHKNPDTGRISVCRASKRCKFEEVTETEYKQYTGVENETLVNPASSQSAVPRVIRKRSKSRAELRDEAYDRIKKLEPFGVRVARVKDLPMKFYHESKTAPPTPEKLYDAGGPIPYFNKPSSALWLSPGVTTVNGKVSTAWRDFAQPNGLLDAEESKTVYEAKLDPEAVVLELTPDNLRYLKKMVDENAGYVTNAPRSFSDSFSYLFDTSGGLSEGEEPFSIPWEELRDSGVDAVRVNGFIVGMSYFYGWDADSLCLLKGDMVKGWESKPAEDDIEKFSYLMIENTSKDYFDGV